MVMTTDPAGVKLTSKFVCCRCDEWLLRCSVLSAGLCEKTQY